MAGNSRWQEHETAGRGASSQEAEQPILVPSSCSPLTNSGTPVYGTMSTMFRVSLTPSFNPD